MAIKAVFAVSQAMQYFNALEVIRARDLKKEECAVIFFGESQSNQEKQLKAVLNENEWGTVKFMLRPGLPPRARKQTLMMRIKRARLKAIRTKSVAREINTFLISHCARPLELIATGNFLARPHRHFLAVAEQQNKAKEVMILDEGTAVPTLMVPLRHNPSNKLPTDNALLARCKTAFNRGRFMRILLFLLTGFNYHHPKHVTFFTVYKNITPPNTDKVEINTFDYLRMQLHKCKKADEVWFLGTCYVEVGDAHQEHFLSLLAQVKADFSNKKLLYCPHRNETEQNLKEIEKLGFAIRRSNFAIEPWIVTHKRMPEAFAAIASSAIDNISYMFRGEIPIHLYRPSKRFYTPSGRRELINQFIDGHVENGFGAVDVRDVVL